MGFMEWWNDGVVEEWSFGVMEDCLRQWGFYNLI